MAFRPHREPLTAAIAVVCALLLGCGGDREEKPASVVERKRLVETAKAALTAYNERVVPGTYVVMTATGRRVSLRVSANDPAPTEIYTACKGRRLRAFPDVRPSVRPDGRFGYREGGAGHRLRVVGRLSRARARG